MSSPSDLELVGLILRDKTLFEDGPPFLVQGRSNRPTRTAAEADRECERVLRFIRKHVRAFPGLELISDKLLTCTDRDPCASGACPRCQRATQRWFSKRAAELIDGLTGRGQCFKCISIIPTRQGTRNRKPSGITGNLMNAIGRLRRGFDAADLAFVVGGLDFSFNEVEGDAGSGKLSIHFWGLGLEPEVSAGRAKLKTAFPAVEPNTPRPVKTPTFDGSIRAFSYAFKDNFQRRVTITTKRRATGAPTSNTRDRPMRVHQKARHWVLLNDLGLLGRMVLRGVEISVTSDGVRLVRSDPAPMDGRPDQTVT